MTDLPITIRNTKEEHTLSHKAHFSPHQSAAWSEMKRQPPLTKLLHSAGKTHCTQTPTWERKAQNASSASLLTLVDVGRKQTPFQLPFGSQKGSCAHSPTLGSCGTKACSFPGKQGHKHSLSSLSKTSPVPSNTHACGGDPIKRTSPSTRLGLAEGTKGF